MKNQGIEYKVTGETRRGQIEGYHQSPYANFLNKTKHKVDVMGLKKPQQKGAIAFEAGEYVSKFTIGMEIEKNQFSRSAIYEYELFKGFERDGSCGYEAITHVLPLLPAGSWRTKVFDMMYKAERIIDDRYSPSDSRCGGHITLSAKGLTGRELMDAVREYSGIVYALFRFRLRNTYCVENKRMDTFYYGSRYQVCLLKDDRIEFRLPNKFESVKQVMRRYELFYELLDFAVNAKGSQSAFFKRITPIVTSMYNGNTDKVKEVLGLAVDFQVYINTGEKRPSVERFL